MTTVKCWVDNFGLSTGFPLCMCLFVTFHIFIEALLCSAKGKYKHIYAKCASRCMWIYNFILFLKIFFLSLFEATTTTAMTNDDNIFFISFRRLFTCVYVSAWSCWQIPDMFCLYNVFFFSALITRSDDTMSSSIFKWNEIN